MGQIARRKVETRKRKSRLKTKAALFGDAVVELNGMRPLCTPQMTRQGLFYALRWAFPTQRRKSARPALLAAVRRPS